MSRLIDAVVRFYGWYCRTRATARRLAVRSWEIGHLERGKKP